MKQTPPPNLNLQDLLYKRTALQWAIHRIEADIVEALLKLPDIKLNIKGDSGETPLKQAKRVLGNEKAVGSSSIAAAQKIVDMLVAKGAPV